jgi:hypothetical protein
MKPLLLVLLAASLVANIVLARRSAPATASAAASTTASPESVEAATSPSVSGRSASANSMSGAAPMADGKPAALVGAVWHAPETEQDLHRIVADLRAAGYPADLIRSVVNHLLKERFASREPNAGQPFWRRGNPTPDAVAAQTALSNERRALFEALLGADARPSAMLDAESRDRRYGALSDDKIDLIAKIERDYGEMSSEAWARRRGNAAASMETAMQTQQLMEQERMADMAAVLTPEEFAQYEMRNSRSANSLMNNLRNIDITEAEYAQLFQAQKAFDLANPMRATMDSSSFAQRQLSQLSLNEAARATLGDARFYSYLEGADRNYANAAQVLGKYANVTPAVIYQVYQLQVELQSLMSQTSRDGPPPADKVAQLRSTVESYNTKLENLVGTEAADAYRKQNSGRIFGSFRSAPRPTGG